MRHFFAIPLIVLALAACSQQPQSSRPQADDTAQTAQPPEQQPEAGAAAPAGQTAVPATAAPSTPAAGTSPGGALASAAPAAPPAPALREVTVPDGTRLAAKLETAVASDTSDVEDAVRATLTRAVTVEGERVLPVGTELTGVVTEATRSGKVKGRARVAFRFTSMRVGDERYDIRTAAVAREARGTKRKDAAKVGIGAGAGAVIGGIIGGGKGAAVGAATGAGAGTAVALSTRGDEVRLPAGTAVTVTLAAPVVLTIEDRRQR